MKRKVCSRLILVLMLLMVNSSVVFANEAEITPAVSAEATASETVVIEDEEVPLGAFDTQTTDNRKLYPFVGTLCVIVVVWGVAIISTTNKNNA